MATKLTERVNAVVSKRTKAALEENAKDNGRSLAGEVRMACEHWLKQNGKRA
jgi:hypothetical protein